MLLFPELLPVQRPLDLPWEAGDPASGGSGDQRPRQVQVVYEFESEPVGLVPWMIVRNARYLTDFQWRQGALFRNHVHESEALLDYDSRFRRLSLAVRGTFPLELFTTLRSDIEALLQERWPHLPLVAAIPCPNSVRGRRCSGSFPLEFVRSALGRGRTESDCRECLEAVPLVGLLSGIESRETSSGQLDRIESILDSGLERVHAGLESIAQTSGEISHGLRLLREEVLLDGGDTPMLVTLASPVGGAGVGEAFRRAQLPCAALVRVRGPPAPGRRSVCAQGATGVAGGGPTLPASYRSGPELGSRDFVGYSSCRQRR